MPIINVIIPNRSVMHREDRPDSMCGTGRTINKNDNGLTSTGGLSVKGGILNNYRDAPYALNASPVTVHRDLAESGIHGAELRLPEPLTLARTHARTPVWRDRRVVLVPSGQAVHAERGVLRGHTEHTLFASSRAKGEEARALCAAAGG